MATTLDEVSSAAQRAWPELALDREAFTAWLGAHPVGAAALAGEPLADDAAAELGIAFACARRDPAALAAFDARYLRGIPAAIAHMRLAPALVDEVVQLVRTKLLTTGEHLERYAGQGRLRGLVQVMAVRTAISEL